MQATTRAFIKRGSAACAAAVVLLGGSFTVATAAPSSEATSAPAITAEATGPAVTTSAPALPTGLAEAVERDLGISVEEFNAQGELAATAAQVQAEAIKADPNALVSVSGDTIKVQASPAAAAAAKAAAGTSKVTVTAAQAQTSAKVDATSVDALFADYVAKFGAAKLQSIMVNGDGEFVIRTGDAAKGGPSTSSPAMKTGSFTAAAKSSVADFAAKYGNVTIEAASGPAAAFATDVTNGQGFIAIDESNTAGGACSIGWNGFNKAGKPAIVTAGHCTGDDFLKNVFLTDPTEEPAVGGPGSVPLIDEVAGTFGASQFGGPGNTPATIPPNWNGQYNSLVNIGTDVAVIDNIAASINQLPIVTDWTTPANPKAGGPKVTGVSDAIIGADICKSGRTTAWDCGKVSEVGVFLVQGTTFPSDSAVCESDNPVPECEDIRAVRGFGSEDLISDQGDSGGAIISGNRAVGMISAGTKGVIAYGVSLTDALKHTDGYTVKIFLETPQVTTTAPVYREGTVSGTVAGAPAGTKVVVTIDGVTTEVAVGADGKWSTKAPKKFGTFSVTAHAKNGFSSSETAEASIEVIKETLPTPAITSPANDSSVVTPLSTIAGTGKPGATVELSGDVTGTAVVGTDGKWSYTVNPGLDLGWYTVTAKQTMADWNDSTSTTVDFTVTIAAPVITSPTNGQKFAFDQGPTAITGTLLEEAQVVVLLNGKEQAVVVDGTNWSVTLENKLATGAYTVEAFQQLDDLQSADAVSKFSVQAEPKPEPTTPPATQKPTPAPSTAPSAAPAKAPSNNGDLANTGASSSMLVLGGAGGLLLLAGSVFLLIRRRNAA